MLRLFVVGLLLSALALPQPAIAGVPRPGSKSSETRARDYTPLEQARTRRSRARIGLAFSIAGGAFGAVLLGFGMAVRCSNGDPASDEYRNCSASLPLTVSGALLVSGGAIGAGFGATSLIRSNQEIEALEGQGPATTLQLGPGGVRLSHCF